MEGDDSHVCGESWMICVYVCRYVCGCILCRCDVVVMRWRAWHGKLGWYVQRHSVGRISLLISARASIPHIYILYVCIR